MVYQQIVGIPMGTNCAPLIADLFLYCYERDFMSDLHKSKRYDLIDIFNDTSRYLDDIFTIDKTITPDAPRLPSYGIYILQLVRFAWCCTSVLDFHSKNLQITSKLLTQGYIYHDLRKHLESSLDRTPNFRRNLVILRSKNIICQEQSLTRSSTVM